MDSMDIYISLMKNLVIVSVTPILLSSFMLMLIFNVILYLIGKKETFGIYMHISYEMRDLACKVKGLEKQLEEQ